MEQIIFFGWLFLALVVNAVDGINDWLKEQLPAWLLVLGIVALSGFHAIDKWSIDFAERVKAIENKLGIQYTPPAVQKKSAWWWLAMFVIAVYILGKSLQAEGLLGSIVGIIVSCVMLLLCAFAAYCFIDEAVRDYWRKKESGKN